MLRPGPLRPERAFVLTFAAQASRAIHDKRLLQQPYLNINALFDLMFGQKIPIKLVESRSMEVALPTNSAHFGINIFDNV
jgi:hypothetical protein